MSELQFYRTRDECYSKQGDYDPLKHILLATDIIKGEGFKNYCLIPYDINLLQSIIDAPENIDDRNYYTVTPTANTIQKLKFDIDCHRSKLSDAEWTQMKCELRMMCLVAIRKKLNEIYNIEPYANSTRFSIDNSSTDEKISFHIVLQDFFVRSCYETKEFIKRLKEDTFFKKYTEYIDTATTLSFQPWRLRGCCKIGKKNYKVGEEGSLEDSLPFPSAKELKDTYHIKILPRITEESNTQTFKNDEKCLDDELENLVMLIKESIENEKHSLCDSEFPNKMCYDNFKKLIFAITRASNGENCHDICHSLHSLYRHSDNWDEDNIDKMIQHTDYGWTKASLHYWAMENEKYNSIFKDQQVARGIERFFSKPHFENITWEDKSKDIEYVEDLDFNMGNTLGIIASLGGGKTSAIIRYINKTNPKRVIILSPRQSYAKSICNEYNERVELGEKFVCYLDVKNKKTIPSINRLVISMESLHYLLVSTSSAIPEFDLEVIDECEANLVQHCCRTTNKEHINANIEVFKHLVQSKVSKIVWADAFMNFKTYNFLNRLGVNIHIVKYLRKMKKRNAIELKGKISIFINALEKSFRDGEKNYCVISAKSRAENLYKYMCKTFPDKKFLLYTGDTKKPKDVRNEWNDVDGIFTTTTITVGINFDTKDVFHNIFIYLSARSKNKIADIIQSHFRVRNIINNKLYFFLDITPSEYLPTNYNIIKRGIHWREDEYLKKHTWFERGGEEFVQLVANCEYEQNMGIMNLRPMFLRYIEECGYSTEGDDDNIYFVLDFEIELSKEDLEDEQFKNIENINSLDAKDLINKRARGIILSRSEKLQLEKYIFVSTFTQNSEAFLEKEYVEALWVEWNNFGKSKILMMRKEKKINDNVRTIRELYEEETDKCNLGCIQSNKLLRLEWMLKLCKDLGLKNSQDTSTIIPNQKLQQIHSTLSSEADNIRKTFNFQDRRTNPKESLSFEDFVDMINTAFKKYGYTRLERGKRSRVRINGKQIEVSDYSLKATGYFEKSEDEKIEFGKLIYENLDVLTDK